MRHRNDSRQRNEPLRQRNEPLRQRNEPLRQRNEPLRQRNEPLRQRNEQMRQRIAAAAARIMAKDGVGNFSVAKRKAARQLGAPDSQALPDDAQIEAELRAYQALYQDTEQRDRIQSLRRSALEVMQALSAFRPHLAGAVLKGIAGRYGDIDLQLFAEDVKSVELFLLNQGIPYAATTERYFAGDQSRLISLLTIDWHGVSVNLAVHPLNDERTTITATAGGRPIERAALAAVRQLVAADD